MTSLKKHIDACTEDLLYATLRAWRAALASMARNAERAIPGVDTRLSESLSKLQDRFLSDAVPATVFSAQQSVDSELSLWADNVERHLRAKAAEARDIMLAMASAAQSLGTRDKRYVSRFRDLTARLEEIADLDDLSEVRRSLVASAFELSTDVRNMEIEGQRTIAGLEVRLEGYRKQLAEAERRECVDALTGILNRRGIESAIAKRREEGRPFCIILLDLNSFKPVNDNYGHMAGDDLLKQFSAEMRAQFRSSDLIGRWGGDEFIVVMDGDPGEARNCVDRVRKWAFGTYKVKTPRGTCAVELSASIGIAVWDRSEDLTQLVSRADESMYEEKRNRSYRP
ncbi:MAG: GGDEF domain-containing protein [Bryobacteraceae bacterium]|jgi:diguanylate cyclase